MIIYFADRYMNILGMASTELPEGLTIIDDRKTEDIETGVAALELTIPFSASTRAKAEACATVGNYILKKGADGDEFYTIIEAEVDTGRQDVQIYAEDAGLDLINEVAGAYAADKAYPISHYVNKYVNDSGFEIGINEVPNLSRKLSWEGEATTTERLASVATQFDGCEISYTFEIKGLEVVKKCVNIFKQRGKDVGVQLRLHKEIDRIITKKSIANLATALQCTGGTPEEEENAVPITLKGYKYDDGDFYVDAEGVVRSRVAVQTWGRLVGDTMSHIVKQYSYDTLSQQTLCSRAITELKKIREMEINFEVEVNEWPDNVSVGDRVNIIDDAGELYLSTRLLALETSEVNGEKIATLGEHLLKSGGINQKVIDLAADFAKMTVSVANAQKIASAAKEDAKAAQGAVEDAVKSVEEAQKAVEEFAGVVDEAKTAASNAQAAADAAQGVVDGIEDRVANIEGTVTTAQQAATDAQTAANTAAANATAANTAAQSAKTEAEAAKASAGEANTAAASATEKANEAKTMAGDAKTAAELASSTASAAKTDAAQAKTDVAAFAENLTTLSNTMQADYTRKTELTETAASLQTQIAQNASQIQSTVQQVTQIDETANNAAALAGQAQSQAAEAQTKADAAKADAEAAQTAAGNAATAAANAQAEADAAKAAATNAQSVANKADEDLAAAKKDLETVQSRVGATEAEIAAAQAKVDAAQAAADEAKTNAANAVQNATAAQSVATQAATTASNAKTVADNAASAAELAQQAANEAKGNAENAVATANEAKTAATNAQSVANAAAENATAAQTAADNAAAEALAAQTAANEADTKAQQAAAELATAQQNLADVTSRVGATEEEVQAAQAAVEAAQAAAEKAKLDAQAAQSTADTAKTNAENAQKAADDAQAAADDAQEAADKAKEAADKAQEDVDALAVRVSTAETSITQNAEQIALRATKTEVTQTLGGYYTKAQADAAIVAKAGEITSSVSSTYATKTELGATDEKADNAQQTADGAQEAGNATNERVTTAESLIQQLADSIKMLVTDGNGSSLMTQTADGWTFSTAELQQAVNDASNGLNDLQESFGSTEKAVETLKEAVGNLEETAEYVKIGVHEDEPCIELGESDSDFKLKITNTRIMFMEGANIHTYIDGSGLVTTAIKVEKELRQGGFAWIVHGSGNYGLIWKGVDE